MFAKFNLKISDDDVSQYDDSKKNVPKVLSKYR